MTERDRQRRLHVANRLEELNAKYGRVDDSLPDWLDHHPETSPASPSPPPRRAPRAPTQSPPHQSWQFDLHAWQP
jgi:hypothetical protein